jgi:hypothetical protein
MVTGTAIGPRNLARPGRGDRGKIALRAGRGGSRAPPRPRGHNSDMPAARPIAPDPAAVVTEFASALTPNHADLVRELHEVIRGVRPEFDVAIKYGLLMYAIDADWRHWIVAIDGHPKTGVGLRFLFGVMLTDERRVLRAGSSVLKTWDFATAAGIDAEAVGGYVAEAIRLYPAFKANEKTVLAAARAARPGASGRRTGGRRMGG